MTDFCGNPKLLFSQYFRFSRFGEVTFFSSLTWTYLNRDVPKCSINSLECAAKRIMLIYQTKRRHTSRRPRYPITLCVTTTSAAWFVIHTYPLPAKYMSYLSLYISVRSKPKIEKHVSPGTYWTASILNEYNTQYYLPLWLVLLLLLIHTDVVNRNAPSYWRRSSVKKKWTVLKFNVSFLFGG